jgi:hypothetical protein
LEKDNINEAQIKNEVESTETKVDKEENVMEENTNIEIHNLMNDDSANKDKIGNSCTKSILANILDQVLIVAASSILVLLCDLVLRLFGYMFVQGTGAIIVAAGIIYFIINCIYAPVMGKSKAKNTIARKILNIN